MKFDNFVSYLCWFGNTKVSFGLLAWLAFDLWLYYENHHIVLTNE